LIDQTTLDPATRLQLERVRTAAEGLGRLMELALTAMGGADEVTDQPPRTIQLRRFLRDVEMRWSGRAREQGLTFDLSQAEDLPQLLTIDRIALERVLSNLLSNAIKYTDAGTVSLRVQCPQAGGVQFRVRDAGPGFSKAALSQLFRRDGRPRVTIKPGTGLGMHISHDMTKRLGGTLEVRNTEDGKGAVVTLTLPPDAIAADTSQQPGTPLTGLPDLSRQRVLVAEDNPTNQMMLGQMLTRLGAEFEIAGDGAQALHLLEREHFDLALVDIEMPFLSGIEVIRALRARTDAQGRIPVLAVTAYVLRANREAIFAAGADGILPKPVVGIEPFGQAIAEVVRKAAAPADSSGNQPSGGNDGFDHARFEGLMAVAGPEGARELLDRVIEDMRRVEREIVQALAEGDRAEIRAQTHVLIAVSGAIGAVRLQGQSQELNARAHDRDAPDLVTLGEELLTELDQMIVFLTRKRGSGGVPQ
jgi:CheY-like chemotaxis protein/HPt (histidine-containing phosphotransfer) domain-containing protein/anti-sigma regulatory factor (Ser/Thr protein kinase)